MPKVYFNEPDRAVARFRQWFYNEKNRHDVRQDMVAKKLGISQQAASKKLKVKGTDQTQLTLRDAIIIFDIMGATDEEILKLMRLK